MVPATPDTTPGGEQEGRAPLLPRGTARAQPKDRVLHGPRAAVPRRVGQWARHARR